MIKLLMFVLFLLLTVVLGLQLQPNPGYVLIALKHWTLETTFWTALVLFLMVVMGVHLLLNAVTWLRFLPKNLHHWIVYHRQRKAVLLTYRGFVAWTQGDFVKAERDLGRAGEASAIPLLNYLLAARAAQSRGDITARDTFLKKAAQGDRTSSLAIGLTTAELQLAAKQWDLAQITLNTLKEIAPAHPLVLTYLLQYYLATHNAAALIALFPALKRANVLTEAETFTYMRDAYYQVLQMYIETNALDKATQLMASLPSRLIDEPLLVSAWVDSLLQRQEMVEAEQCLYQALRKNQSECLLIRYATLPPSFVQLKWIESLVKKAPDSAILYYCLGLLNMGRHSWDPAREALEKSIALAPTPRAYLALAELFEYQDNCPAAAHAYRQGLLLC